MFEVFWEWLRSLYGKVEPKEIPDERNSEEPTEITHLKNSPVGHPSGDGRPQQINATYGKKKSGKVKFYDNSEQKYLLNKKLIQIPNNFIDRRMLVKHPSVNNCSDVLAETVASHFEKSSNHAQYIVAYPRARELKPPNIAVSFSNAKIDINNHSLILADRRKPEFVSTLYCHGLSGSVQTMLEPGLLVLLDSNLTYSNCFSSRSQELTTYKGHIKLNNKQILSIRVIACYLTKHLDTEEKPQMHKTIGDIEKIYYKLIYDDTSDFEKIQPKKKREANVIITELDSTDDMETVKKQKTQRKRKIKKKYRKSKLNNYNIQSSLVPVSSTLCLESLSFFMNTNQWLTHSKMFLEIEKGFKPIKRKIAELQKSMNNFVIINNTKFGRRVDVTRLSEIPLVRSTPKVRSIYSVPSTSLLRLDHSTNIADITNIEGQSCSEMSLCAAKQMSPLAEMYIKLSRQ